MALWRTFTATLTNGSKQVTIPAATLLIEPRVYAGYTLRDAAGALYEIDYLLGEDTIFLVEDYTGTSGSQTVKVIPNGTSAIIDQLNKLDALNTLLGNAGRELILVVGVVPTTGQGRDGAIAIDPVNRIIYGPKSGTWPAGVNMGGLATATYDPANIAQQVVGITATQGLKNKFFAKMDNAHEGGQVDFEGADTFDVVHFDLYDQTQRLFTNSDNDFALNIFNAGGGAAQVQLGGQAVLSRIGSTNFLNNIGELDAVSEAAIRAKVLTELNVPVIVGTATYSFILTDAGKLIEATGTNAKTFTVPNDSTVNFPVNSRIDVFQVGTGQVTFAAGSGVTLRVRENRLKMVTQYSLVSLWKRAANDWALVGDLIP